MARLVGWVSVLLLLAPPASPEGVTRPRPLRYVSFNVLHGGLWSGLFGRGDRLEQRLAIVVEELRALDVDVVGLQEASTGLGRGNVAERIATALGFHYVFAPATRRTFASELANRVFTTLINFTEGPAILSRFPIGAWEAWELPRCTKPLEARILLYAEVETPWGRLPVFSTHTRNDSCQTGRVAELVRARRARLPGVLMGDFNAGEGSPAAGVFGAAGFLDAFRAANPDAPGFTVWQRVETPDRMARRRVDYVFVIPGEEVPGRVLSSRVVLDHPRALGNGAVLWPSDHYGVLAELEVFAPVP
jgi:endonuclease/exonuclease/phosphatase family metal-dependent hydrolase